VRRETEHSRQLKRLYSVDSGRLQGKAGREKLPFFWFLLFLSYKCTRRCKYCYAFNQVGDDSRMEMDEGTFSRLLEWIPEVWRVNNVKVNAIGFLGGEPLLRTDRIRRMMDSVYKNTDGMQGFLYTNADRIDSVNWEDLEDIQWISTNITDIPLDELSRRMAIIRERSNVIGQTIVATLDDYNLGRIADISRFGIENGYRLRYYANFYQGLDVEYRDSLLQKYHQLCDLFESYILKGYDVHTVFLFDILVPLWDEVASSPYPCGERIATVFPDGTIGPCIRNHFYKTGTIFDADPLGKLQCSIFQHGLNNPGIPDECRTCESRIICQGGCPNEKLVLTGATEGKAVLCELHKQIIPRLQRLDQLIRGIKLERFNL
jgi:radical SAM protein with 4Fe4S-binding SPASM domain